ncbi:HEPACAM family member 2 [Pelodytes ibericus]
MELHSATYYFLKCNIYLLLLDTCSSLTLRIPSMTIHGIAGKPLLLPVHYNFNTSASGIQIIWLLERPNCLPIHLVNSMNQTVVPDLEFQHKFTLRPPNASLLIHSLNLSDAGNYIVKVNIPGSTTISSTQKIQVTVNVPVSKPDILRTPNHEVVENVDNITFNCSVKNGTGIKYHWLINGNVVQNSPRYIFMENNQTFIIKPVMKDDVGNYSCVAKNVISELESKAIAPIIYYGPYGLTVSSDKGRKVGEVFTVNIGEPVQFDCSADSNPPITSEWIQRTENTTEIINKGPYFKVLSYKAGQRTMDYMCRAYNNITRKLDETQFTVIITSIDHQKLLQNENSLSPLAAITGVSLFLILCICLLFVWKKYQLHKAIRWKIQERRPSTEYRRTQIFSGHEDALNDFGIYEFVALPDPSFPLRVPSSKSASVSNASQAHDTNCTVYEVIRHVPEQPNDESQLQE